MRGRALLLRSVALALLLFSAAAAWAQTDVTMARITGTVKDEQGQPLPGALVEAKNQETGLMARAVADANGFYRLLNLPPGVYTLTASLSGFATLEKSDVRLVLGSAPTVDFTLPAATTAETVTVTAETPLVEVTNTTVGATILNEQIKSLPLNGRDFTSLVYLTPETRRESQRGYISISGQRGINTNVTVDGVDYNNAFFGGQYGTAEGRAPLAISQESIKEFAVITNGASAEFGRSGGGFVNVITKSGTNDYHGSAFYYWQPQDLASDPPVGEKLDQEKKQFGGSFGGAFVKDKLFFFTSYDQQDQSLTIPIDPRVLDADIFAKYPVLASPPQYVQTRDGRVLFTRFDFFASPQHRFMARMNYGDYEGINGTSTSPTRTESYNGIEGMFSRSYVASYSGTWSDNLLNDFNFQYVLEDTPRRDKGLGLPDIQVRGIGNYGEVSFLPITSTADRTTIFDTVTYMWQDHVFKGGFEYNDTSIDQIFKGNWRGVFIFNNKADFLAGKWSEYRQFGGLQGLTADEAGRSNFGQKEYAAFLQDQWFLSPQLTLTLGLRWERLDNPDFPILNLREQNPDGTYKLNGKIPDEDNQWSPRIGVSWAPAPKTAVRFSAGRFWSRTPALLWAQTNTSNGLKGTQYLIFAQRDNRGNVIGPPTDPLAPGWGSAWNPQGVERVDFSSIPIPRGVGVFTVDPNFRNPYTDRVTLEFERELFANTAASLSITYAESKQLERLTDANLRYDGTTSANGLPHYDRNRPNPAYGRVTVYTSDARSKYWGISLLLQRRFVERFFGMLSVTWSEDKDNDSNERNFAGLFAEDKNNLDLNWGWSDRDQRWKIAANGTWNTPWWGISLSGLFRFATGQPYTAFAGADLNGDQDSGTDRPTVGGKHFPRNSFRQPDTWSLDLRLQKTFDIKGFKLAAIAECFNCTDREEYTVTNTIWGTGETPRSTFGAKSYTGTPRTIQLAIRLDF
ncbi:MAG: membrane protein [Thermoanaerobaculum sp.]|nr:MAG: membrane protein [Thermoanaerobaculum sp.]